MEKPKKSLNGSLDSLVKPSSTKTMSSISTAKKLTSLTWKTTFKNLKKINCNQPILEKGSKKMESSSAKWHRLPKLSPLIKMEVRPSRKSSWMMSIYSLVMIESFQKIAARWGLSRRNKSKGKPSFASGHSFHSRLINPWWGWDSCSNLFQYLHER